MSKANDQRKLQTAFSLQQAGNLDQAAAIYRQLIETDRKNFYALHYLGIIEASSGNLAQAKSLIARSLSIRPPNIQFMENYAAILFQSQQYEDALQICRRGLQFQNVNASLLYVSAVSLYKLKNLADSLEQFDQLLKLQPNHIAAINERASVLAEMKNYDAALASIEKALTIQPQYAEAYLNKGNLCIELKRYDEAMAAYESALALKADLAEAWLGRGRSLREFKRYDEALAAYERALTLKPDLAEAWLGRGNAFVELQRYDDAFTAYDNVLMLKPDSAEAWLGRGNAFTKLKRYDQAFVAYDKALALEPGLANAEGARFHAKMQICEWSDFDRDCAHLMSSIRNGVVASPFALLPVLSSPEQQFAYAKLYCAQTYPASANPVWQGERYNHDRIRVAYLSADFRDHPVSYSLAGVFEQHDRKQFETIAISSGSDIQSEMRARLKSGVDRFIDVNDQSDADVAKLLRALEVDIVVDLMGHTEDARTAVLARRPSPIQVNYLGYAATLGADYADYLIADPTVISEAGGQYYSEKIAYVPNSFFPSDSTRPVSDRSFARAEMGLPQAGFVFCCFNNSYKLNPHVFDGWMRILTRVEGSVLWLSESNATSVSNLKKEARNRGVSEDKLIFAKRMPLMADHLARLRLADLFLDTDPYNAHTTASDALWVGLPVLTRIGEAFAGRVAASLLTAINLPELITATPQAYENLAIELAANPDKLAAIKRQLANNRLTTPLFDTKRYTRHLEVAYKAMHERHQAGLPPDTIHVPR
jgi:predicted O-linked N-acetylglucosamine transferase (SPINDLY family)